mmetsp:Transcript_12953/g.32645  ORF Transcript_12953/g.32645 Transcript_12953/m.32645 type:complete len:376 (-) Transcript_12953:168-1295(-)
MGILRLLGIAVPLLAVAIGLVSTFAPLLFFKIPGGWILWAITGHVMPPYFDTTPFKSDVFGTWVKDNDVIVSTGVKQGTNWMLYCVHQIRTKASDELPWYDINYNTPWVSLIQKPGMTWADLSHELNHTKLADGTPIRDIWNHPDLPFRVFKAHEIPRQVDADGNPDPKPNGGDPGVLPLDEFPNVKFIAMVREGKDMVVSLNTFFRIHSKEFKDMWAGFPPNHETMLETVKSLLPGGNLYPLYFGYLKGWWPYRHRKNVLLVHFTDMIKDLRGGVQKLADFVSVKLTDKEMDKVVERCHFSHMKHLNENFGIQLFANPNNITALTKSSKFFVRGTKGHGKDIFDEEATRVWKEAVEKELSDPAMRKFAEEGGPF